ncbi:MAG TPA: GAF domain-containing sensor histidine kinase [Gaiellaceae bacterium]|nr:GAF domain-containing sensor histidine kinase [Gaiellaceae bacterium]
MSALGRLGHRLVATEVVNLVRLKWFAIVLPLAALVLLVVLLRSSLHDWLHESPGVLFLGVFFAVCVFLFASVVFALIEDFERRILDQNRELAELVARTDQQNAELSALLTVGRASASSVELPAMLDEALDAILAVTPAEAAELWLVEGGGLTLERFRGVGASAFASQSRLLLDEGLPGAAVKAPSAVVVHDLGSDPRFAGDEVAALDLQTFCALPLRRPTGTIGVLAVAARGETAFESPGERRLLEAIAERVGLAIENAQLHEQVLDRAVLEERERIARELHDGLAQVLGYINTQTLAVKKLLETRQLEGAIAQLDAMGAASRDVYGDVREAIVGLRTAPTGLVPALRDYLSRLPRIPGCEVELRLPDGGDGVELAPSTEIQVVRIVQEALSNVRKHSAASHVEVIVRADEHQVGVDIVDDGRGFDPLLPARTGWPQLGLQTMRERAQAVGGTYEVVSSPGAGTRVSVLVPAAARREAVRAGAAR